MQETLAEKQLKELIGGMSPEVPVAFLQRDATLLVVGQVGKRVGKYCIGGLGSILEYTGEKAGIEALKTYGGLIARGIIGIGELAAFVMVPNPAWRNFIIGTVWEQIDNLVDTAEAYVAEALKK